MKLTPIEKETIFLYNEAEENASIYTHDKRLIRKLETLAKKFPDQFRLEEHNRHGAVSYIVPKRSIIIRAPYNQEYRDAASKRLRKRWESVQNHDLTHDSGQEQDERM